MRKLSGAAANTGCSRASTASSGSASRAGPCTGRIVAIIELGSTFQPELTGIENLHLYALTLGLSSRQIRERAEAMFAFSGVEEFANVPLKYYS